jgi:hypothetical protein
MTTKPKKENVSVLLAKLIDTSWQGFRNRTYADAPQTFSDIQKLKDQLDHTNDPLEKRLTRSELLMRILDAELSYQTGLLWCALSMVADNAATMTETPKSRKTKQDALKERVKKAKQDIDEHLAKRIAKIYDTTGHGAMYGAGNTPNHSD